MNPSQNEWPAIVKQLLERGVYDDWLEIHSSKQAAVFYKQSENIFVKVFITSKQREKIKQLLLPNLSRHESFIRKTQFLREKQLPSPELLCSGTIENAGKTNGFVISKGFKGVGLGDFFAQHLSGTLSNRKVRWRRNVLRSLGELIARLHNNNIAHGDLRPNNVLLNCCSQIPKFSFIDNERNQYFPFGLMRRARIKNLVQLNMIWLEDVCLTDRLRFAKSYFDHLSVKIPRKKLIREVQQKTLRRLEGKPKDGYRNTEHFRICVPDFSVLLE